MQKQLKNLKYKHKNLLKPQDLRKLKSLFRNKPQVFNTVFTNLFKRERQQRKLKIIIKLTPNNIFCTLVNFPLNKNLLTKSAGSYKMNISKKKLKFSNKIILQNFLKSVNPFSKNNFIIIQISGPLKLRKAIIKQLATKFMYRKIVIKVKELKSFNGCRPKKKKRKKKKGLRILK